MGKNPHPLGTLVVVVVIAVASYFAFELLTSNEKAASADSGRVAPESVFAGSVDPMDVALDDSDPMPEPAGGAQTEMADTASSPQAAATGTDEGTADTVDDPAELTDTPEPESDDADLSEDLAADPEPSHDSSPMPMPMPVPVPAPVPAPTPEALPQPGADASAPDASAPDASDEPMSPTPSPRPAARTQAAPKASNTGVERAGPPDARLVYPWWPTQPRAGSFDLIYAGQLAKRSAIALNFSQAVDPSSASALKVLDDSGKPVGGQWKPAACNPRMLVFETPAAGRYTVVVGPGIKDQRGRELGYRAEGPVYLRQ